MDYSAVVISPWISRSCKSDFSPSKFQLERNYLKGAKGELNPPHVLNRQRLVAPLQNSHKKRISQTDRRFNRCAGPVSMRLIQSQDDVIRILGFFQGRQLNWIPNN